MQTSFVTLQILFVQLKLCNKPGGWSLRVVKVFQGQGNSAKKEIVDVVAHIIYLPKNWSTPKRFLLMKKIQEKSHIWLVMIYDYVIVIVPMQSSEHHLCSIAMAGNLPEEENH